MQLLSLWKPLRITAEGKLGDWLPLSRWIGPIQTRNVRSTAFTT